MSRKACAVSENNLFALRIISPDKVFYDGKVFFTEMVTSEGEIGIYKNHIPVTNILVSGVVKIYENTGIKEAVVNAGFVEILPEEVVVMAQGAQWRD